MYTVSWELDRTTVNGWLLAAEFSGATDPGIADIRKAYNIAVAAHDKPNLAAVAEAAMANLAAKLAGSWNRNSSPAEFVDVARTATQDAKKAIADLPDPFFAVKVALGLAAAGGLAYLAWRFWPRKKKGKSA